MERFRNMSRQFINVNNNSQEAEILGPLKDLPGVWTNKGGLEGRGWNMIALPFGKGQHKYRLLCNQFNEDLKFNEVADVAVPNRGANVDQKIAAIDYEQTIHQIAQDDSPRSGLAGTAGDGIHHEPGLFLHIIDNDTNQIKIARSASIPHGNSVMMMGRHFTSNTLSIPDTLGLPLGFQENQLGNNSYLDPYNHFHRNLFQGIFDPVHPAKLLNDAIAGKTFSRVVTLDLSTESAKPSTGALNTPFINREAKVVSVTSIFWIEELTEKDLQGKPVLQLQYLQNVVLEFLGIKWPHVSINTLRKASTTVNPNPSTPTPKPTNKFEEIIKNLETNLDSFLAKFDTNRDGGLNFTELVSALASMGMDFNTARTFAWKVFNTLDKDHNQRIDRKDISGNSGTIAGWAKKITLISPAEGQVFSHFPRQTQLTWSPLPGVGFYTVQVEFFDNWRRQWNRLVHSNVNGTHFNFQFVGAQSGRWKISAGGTNVASEWRTFRYTV